MSPPTSSAPSGGPSTVLVTVGSTSFDELIRAVDSPSVAQLLRARGHTALTLQVGRGAYVPHNIVGQSGKVRESLRVQS